MSTEALQVVFSKLCEGPEEVHSLEIIQTPDKNAWEIFVGDYACFIRRDQLDRHLLDGKLENWALGMLKNFRRHMVTEPPAFSRLESVQIAKRILKNCLKRCMPESYFRLAMESIQKKTIDEFGEAVFEKPTVGMVMLQIKLISERIVNEALPASKKKQAANA